MRIGEERTVELTDNMQELVACGHVEIIEDLSEDYTGMEIKEMSKRQLIKYAKDNKIPIAEKEKHEKVLEQVESHLGIKDEKSEAVTLDEAKRNND
ncbi:hypothetical protein [Emergencia sp.]|uniref:hypothetical protein n=1 Tax=Emergencia sp. TaxID=1926557 RepID=UPI003AF19EDB